MGRPKGSANKPENAKTWTFRALSFDEAVEIRLRCMNGEVPKSVGRSYGVKNAKSVFIILDCKEWNGQKLPDYTPYTRPELPTEDGTRYKDIPGVTGYKAGDNGSIWSFISSNSSTETPWKEIVQTESFTGYLAFTVKSNDKKVHWKTHVLVALLFLGERPSPNSVCRHLDGNKHNNHVKNLRYGTVQENIDDRTRHGTQSMAKLTEQKVADARKRHKLGEKEKDLAREYGVGRKAMHYALNGTTWKDVPFG